MTDTPMTPDREQEIRAAAVTFAAHRHLHVRAQRGGPPPRGHSLLGEPAPGPTPANRCRRPGTHLRLRHVHRTEQRDGEHLMTTALHPDTGTAKNQTLKDWRETHPNRPCRLEELTDWTTVRLDDGGLLLSARIVGPDPATALREFSVRQEERLCHRVDPSAGDQPPSLDVSVPGRTACVWRLGGVWVEVWHPNMPVPVPGPPRAAQPVSRPVPAPPHTPAVTTPSGRLPLGQRLTNIRRTLTAKEN